METSSNPPKIKELGFLELKITAVMLDLLGYPLALCFEFMMENSR